jgi:hypothetical protein
MRRFEAAVGGVIRLPTVPECGLLLPHRGTGEHTVSKTVVLETAVKRLFSTQGLRAKES